MRLVYDLLVVLHLRLNDGVLVIVGVYDGTACSSVPVADFA